MSAQHMKKAGKTDGNSVCTQKHCRTYCSFLQKHVDDNEVNGAAWAKDLELLYQYETLQ